MEAIPQFKRVLLVDDHRPLRRQVEQLLRDEFDVAGSLSDGERLAAAVAGLHPDIIILDITLPGASGIELARRLTASGCPARIVFLTVHADVDYACEAVAAGGLGYVVKSRLVSDLVPALRAALAGERFFSPCPELAGLCPGGGGS